VSTKEKEGEELKDEARERWIADKYFTSCAMTTLGVEMKGPCSERGCSKDREKNTGHRGGLRNNVCFL
jgi:hypothetical protein